MLKSVLCSSRARRRSTWLRYRPDSWNHRALLEESSGRHSDLPLPRRASNAGQAGLPVVVAILAGSVFGLGIFTFRYGEGLSYFSTDPRACKNCHVMNEYFDSWSHGPHHAVAGCVDCHLPHDFLWKYVAKADNGYRHSKAFTFMDFHEPIQMIERNRVTLQENCLRCHSDFVHGIVRGSSTQGDAMRCVHCHRQIGHGGRP